MVRTRSGKITGEHTPVRDPEEVSGPEIHASQHQGSSTANASGLFTRLMSGLTLTNQVQDEEESQVEATEFLEAVDFDSSPVTIPSSLVQPPLEIARFKTSMVP